LSSSWNQNSFDSSLAGFMSFCQLDASSKLAKYCFPWLKISYVDSQAQIGKQVFYLLLLLSLSHIFYKCLVVRHFVKNELWISIFCAKSFFPQTWKINFGNLKGFTN